MNILYNVHSSCFCVWFFYLISVPHLYRQLKKQGVSLKFMLLRKIQMQLLHFMWVSFKWKYSVRNLFHGFINFYSYPDGILCCISCLKTLLLMQSLVKLEGWESLVTIISYDMRYWNAPEKADILVWYRFSFGCNCLYIIQNASLFFFYFIFFAFFHWF